jgi:hypothetical protein
MMQWAHTKAVFADAGNAYYKNEYDQFSIDQIRSHSCAFCIFMTYHRHQELNTSSIPKVLILLMVVILSTMLLDPMHFKNTSK